MTESLRAFTITDLNFIGSFYPTADNAFMLANPSGDSGLDKHWWNSLASVFHKAFVYLPRINVFPNHYGVDLLLPFRKAISQYDDGWWSSGWRPVRYSTKPRKNLLSWSAKLAQRSWKRVGSESWNPLGKKTHSKVYVKHRGILAKALRVKKPLVNHYFVDRQQTHHEPSPHDCHSMLPKPRKHEALTI